MTPTSSIPVTGRLLKRSFDVVVALVGLVALSWLIVLVWLAATVDTRANGFFLHERVGRGGRRFHLLKIRTMRDRDRPDSPVTVADDPRVTAVGRLLRRWKLDELPQLVNVLVGHMSLVGPRPDVPGFADLLEGEDRRILELRPGITGPATLRFRGEEALLARQDDPERYNREVLFPEKVRINLAYLDSYTFTRDLHYILLTLLGRGPDADL